MHYRFYLVLSLVLTALLNWSCEKNVITIPNTPVTVGARVKFVHAAPEAIGIDLFLNSQKISGSNPTSTGLPLPITYGNTFPGAAANYAVTPVGQLTATLTAPAATTVGSATVVTTASITLEDGKYYSVFASGTGPQPDMLTITDDFSAATDPAKFYVRFVNLLVGGPQLDLGYAKGAVLQANVAYKSASSFVALNVADGASFEIRPTGTNAVILPITSTSNAAGRILTVVLTGIAGRTGTTAPKAFVYVNR